MTQSQETNSQEAGSQETSSQEAGSQETGIDQTALWNGAGGKAWVDAQAIMDAMLQPFETLLEKAVAERSARDILDIGCGTGATTLAMARLLKGQGRATGLDISEPMLALARARAEEENSPARFINADAQTHEFTPAGYDMMISRFGVMFFSDNTAAFSNLRRALKDDGALCMIAWRSAAENPFMTVAETAAAPFIPAMPARDPHAPGQFAFADAEKLRGILKESGWAHINIEPVDETCTLPEAALTRFLTRLGPLGLMLQDADEEKRAHIINVVRAAFDPYIHGDAVRFNAACWKITAAG